MCWWKSATAAWPTTSSSIGHNFEAVLGDLETRMREAAADLNFEEAARLRDEVKRLRATELAVVDDPTAKQRIVQDKAGAYAGAKKYGESANLPRGSSKRGGTQPPRALRGGGCDPPAVHAPQSPQTPSRRNARPGIPALPPRPHALAKTLARRRGSHQRQQNLPAHRLAPIRPRIRPRPALQRRRAGTSGWVEEAVGSGPRGSSSLAD